MADDEYTKDIEGENAHYIEKIAEYVAEIDKLKKEAIRNITIEERIRVCIEECGKVKMDTDTEDYLLAQRLILIFKNIIHAGI